MRVNATARIGRLPGVADPDELTGRAGLRLVADLADRVELTAGLSAAVADRTTRRGRVDDGKALRDLVLVLVDGGDAVSDVAALAHQLGRRGLLGLDRRAGDRSGRRRRRRNTPPVTHCQPVSTERRAS